MDEIKCHQILPDCARTNCGITRHQPFTQILHRCKIPRGYSLVVATALGSAVLVVWQALNVSKARIKYKVPHPPPVLFTSDPDIIAFNCAVRPFYHTMQHIPQFLFFLFIGGLAMPYFSTIGGLVWIIGRIDSSWAYYSRDPNRRTRGAYGIWGIIFLMVATGKFAFSCCRW